MLKEGIVIGERYEIISHVGAGGMADVYKARDHKLNRLVAVKVLKAEFRQDTGFVAKFRKEAQAAAGLSHPNVVNVFDVGEDRGLYYIVMELVEGITLKEYIAKKRKLSVREATSIAIQVSLGLEAAHSQGIVHRDVKPQNIIISTDGKVKLSDFGIAKAINSNTITANVMGSVHYSSPEQVRGGFSDTKSDIYSLGITMYEMVTGRVPFDGDSTVAIAIKHLQEEIVPPSKFAPDLPYSLEQIILKMTQKDPNRRYAYMGELIEDLKRSLSDPQGNFVSLTPLRGHASTLPHSKAETAVIQEAAEKKSYLPPTEEEKEPEEEERPAKTKKKEKTRSRDEDEDAGSSGLEKAITIGGFLIGAVIIIILVVVIGNMLGLFGKSSSSNTETQVETQTEQSGDITVPDFSGMTLAEAQNEARELSIGIKQSGTEPSDTVAQGHIISQDVTAGTAVTANSTVNVVISSGSSSAVIPAGIVGMQQSDAEAALTALGLTTSVTQEANDAAAGTVISVNPTEGASVAVGTSVSLVVSSGPSAGTVAVPDLRGYDQASAISVLDSMGLANTVVAGSSDDMEDGQVISVSPEAGTEVATGSVITLTVKSSDAQAVDSGSNTWVCTTSWQEPYEYNGGNVTIELVQGDTTTTVYEGDSPFDENGNFTGVINGKDGESSGTLNIYEEGNLIAQVGVEFAAP